MDQRIRKTAAKAGQASLEVLADGGFAAFTMEAVAERSGIAKSTLYRHWPNRIALLADALEALNTQPGQGGAVGEGAVRGRVIELLTHLVEVMARSPIGRVIPALIEAAEHHPEVADFLHAYSAARRATLVSLLRRGIELGEIGPGLDPELAALALSGPIFYCRLMSPMPFPPARIPALVDLVLREAGRS